MAVKKPLMKPSVNVDELIDRGAKVREDIPEKTKWPIINLRISSPMLNQVDSCVKNRVGITRTGWLLEAVHEKIVRESMEPKDY